MEVSILTQLVFADGRDSSIQLQARQGQVVGLPAGVLPHLLDPDVSPALLLVLGGVQGPRGRRPDTRSAGTSHTAPSFGTKSSASKKH